MEDVSRCALPGCGETLPPASPGRPPRRYCSPEHRAKARVINRRRAAAAAGSRAVAPTPSVLAPLTQRTRGAAVGNDVAERPRVPLALPAGSAAEPVEPRPPVPGPRRPVTTASLVALRDRIDGSTRRRRRLVALVGITGIIASGAGWLSSSSTIPPSQPSAEPLASNNQWISEAAVRLAAIDRQLDAIAQAEATYETRLAPRFAGRTPPRSVSRLQERKALLVQQKAALRSQVATVEQVDSAATELAETEKQLADLDDVLETSTAPTRSQDQADALAALNEQRDLLQRRRDAKKEDLDRLEKGATSAKSSPLPEPDERVKELAAAVIDLVENPDTHRDEEDESRDGQPYTPPSVVASGRESTDRRGPSHTTGEPGADPEEGRPPIEPPGGGDRGTGEAEPGGVLGTVKDGLGRVVDGPSGSAGAAPSAGAPGAAVEAPGAAADAGPSAEPGGAVGTVKDGLGRVVDGPGRSRAEGPGGRSAGGPDAPAGPPTAATAAAPAPAEPKGGGLIGSAADGLGDVLDGPDAADPGPGSGPPGESSAGRAGGSAEPAESAADDSRSRPRGKAARNAGGASSDSSDSGPVVQPLGGSSAEPAVVTPSELRSSPEEAPAVEAPERRSTPDSPARPSRSADRAQEAAPTESAPERSSEPSRGSSSVSDDVVVDRTVDALKDFTAENPEAAGSVGLHEGMADEEWESAARTALRMYADYETGGSEPDGSSHDRSSDSWSTEGAERSAPESAEADGRTGDVEHASSRSYSSGDGEHEHRNSSDSSDDTDHSSYSGDSHLSSSDDGHGDDGGQDRWAGSSSSADHGDGGGDRWASTSSSSDDGERDDGGHDRWAGSSSSDDGDRDDGDHDRWSSSSSSDDGGGDSWDNGSSDDGDQGGRDDNRDSDDRDSHASWSSERSDDGDDHGGDSDDGGGSDDGGDD